MVDLMQFLLESHMKFLDSSVFKNRIRTELVFHTSLPKINVFKQYYVHKQDLAYLAP